MGTYWEVRNAKMLEQAREKVCPFQRCAACSKDEAGALTNGSACRKRVSYQAASSTSMARQAPKSRISSCRI